MADAVVVGDVSQLEILALEQPWVLRVVVLRAGFGAAEGDAGFGYGFGRVAAVAAVWGVGEPRLDFRQVVTV